MSRTFPFVKLSAVTAAPRSESLNVGLVAWPFGSIPILMLDHSPSRLRALHPNLARMDLDVWKRSVLAELASVDDLENQLALLPHLVQPFSADVVAGLAESDPGHEHDTLDALFTRLVAAPPATIASEPRKVISRLETEIRGWLRKAKLYSRRLDDLSRRRVVSHFPVDASTDLYVDFALKNGKIHVIETLDMRGLRQLTPAARGVAAMKSITLAEARGNDQIGRKIALISVTDSAIAQPAIRLVERYADDVWHMGSAEDRMCFAKFVSKSLHVDQLIM